MQFQPLTTWFWFDEWRGDKVRSRLCVRQLKAEQSRDDLFAGTLETSYERDRHTFCQTSSVGILGWHLKFDERDARSVLDKSVMGGATQ